MPKTRLLTPCLPVLLLVLGASAGCDRLAVAPPAAPPVAPPAPNAPIRTAMWSMASKTNQVATLLAKPPPLAAADLQEVRTLVDDVAKIAAGLAADASAHKHPQVKEGLPDFQTALVAAQAGLAKDPADTAPAAALGASCQSCHGQGKSAPPFAL